MRIVGLVPVLALGLLVSGCQGGNKGDANKYNTGLKKLETTDVKVGTGRTAEKDDMVFVLYRGTFIKDGKQFDANMDDVKSKMPYGFVIGQGGVIVGWEEGIAGMKEGGERILMVPTAKAYGAAGNGPVPANADLKFDVKLLYVFKKSEQGVYDANDDKVGTGPEAKAGDTVKIHYVGTYLTGKQWDNTRERGDAVTFQLKVSEESMPGVIAGIQGMKAGGKRTLVLPPSLAFGAAGTQSVTGNQPLKIVIELLEVNGKGA